MANAIPVSRRQTQAEVAASQQIELEQLGIPVSELQHDDLKELHAEAVKAGKQTVLYPNQVRVDN